MEGEQQEVLEYRQLNMFEEAVSQSHGVTGEGGTGAGASEELQTSTAPNEGRVLAQNLMEKVIEGENLNRAYRRVKANKGSPGIDGMTAEGMRDWLKTYKGEVVEQLVEGIYQPKPVKRVEIPKEGGGKRELGIPTVIDRMVQQAILQVLSPLIEPTFSERSYGFRPGRGSHDAIRQASEYVAEGREIVVDIDIEKFFDRVNHDVLMSRLARRIGDKGMLRIIRRFLEAGIMVDGVCIERREGTPQRKPLSPLLANVLLDDLDKELERRGHSFCRYADDCNIYVQSQVAGERVMESITRFIERRLRLKVNRKKSGVAHVSQRKFLGYRLDNEGRLLILPQSIERAKEKIREITRRNRPMTFKERIKKLNEFLVGWIGYYRLAKCWRQLKGLEGWTRRKLRCVRLKQCKRAKTVARFLIEGGVPEWNAWILALSGKGWWRKAGTPQANQAMNIVWFNEQGLISLTGRYLELRSIGNRRGTEQVCPVV